MEEINEKYAQINELKAMLASTDYMFIKQVESGYIPPHEVVNERQAAREKINTIESEIEQLKLAEQSEMNKEL